MMAAIAFGLLIPLASFTGALSASQQVISLVTSPLAGAKMSDTAFTDSSSP